METLTLEERDGRTLARTVSVYQSVEDRDAVVQSGMENGVREGTERLEETQPDGYAATQATATSTSSRIIFTWITPSASGGRAAV